MADQTLLRTVLNSAIEPALRLLPQRMDSPAARVMLLAIGLQESGLTTRRQAEDGPARGLWQFEMNGGVRGVYAHAATTELVRLLCRDQDCGFEPRAIWAALAEDDILAAGIARLLLYADSAALPEPGLPDASWACYQRNWRPGHPRPETWPANYQQAMAAVGV